MDGVQTAKPVASPSSGPLTPSELSSLSPSALSPEAIHPALLHLSDEEAITICSALLTSRRIEDPRLAKALIDLGFIRADKILSRIEADVRDALGGAQGKWDQWSGEQIRLAMEKVLIGQEGLEPVLRCCVTLHDIKHRLDIYDVIYPPAAKHNERPPLGSLKESVNEQHTGTPMDLDDPWDDGTSDSGAEKQDVPALDDPWEAAGSDVSGSVKSIKVDGQPPPTDTTDLPDPLEPPIPLSTFLAQTLLESSLSVAASALIPALQIIRDRYPSEIYPYRFALLDAMPGWVPPGELESAGLLPQLGDDGREKAWPSAQRMAAGSFLDVLSTEYRAPNHSSLRSPRSQLFSSKELSEWYAQRILSLDSVGLLDVQLGWVQFGASSGVPGLDALGENLSLLSRLIYDANLSPTQQERWNLSSWRAASQGEIVKAYLSGSTAGSIVNDIKRLVLPYLYVLESRAERAGMPDPQLVERLLHDAVLHLRLHLALPVFEASKATLPVGSRLIRKDMNVARLALACLYGSEQREVWATMSAIFECLPVWDVSGGDIEADKEATSTTLESIATFVRPTRAGARPPTAHDLFVFFSPLPFASLSRALDILDVHLESGEILARWETAVQLRFLLQSARNTGDQVELAERMVRRQASRGPHTDTRWTSLWNDMRKLNGGDDALLRGAFGMLSIEQMMRTYVGGVLSSGSEQIHTRTSFMKLI